MQPKTMLALFLFSTACASGSTGEARVPQPDRNVLTTSEIALSSGTTAHDVISQLRPQFLRARGLSTLALPVPATAVVYVDNMALGGIEALRNIDAQTLLRIEYMNAADATTRFGTDHTAGAILIFTKR